MATDTLTLTVPEAKRLTVCIKTVTNGQAVFIEVGKSLAEIRDTKLYRETFNLILTRYYRQLLATLRTSFEGISDTVEKLVARDSSGPLTISVLPSFAAKWLVGRLGRFQALHPEVDLRISASNHSTDFSKEDVDAGIRHGLGEYPGLRTDWLLPGALLAVCSPMLLKGNHPLKKPEHLSHHTLLHATPANEWPMWLKAHSIKGVDASRGKGVFESLLAHESLCLGLVRRYQPKTIEVGREDRCKVDRGRVCGKRYSRAVGYRDSRSKCFLGEISIDEDCRRLLKQL